MMYEELTQVIIGSCYEVANNLGYGLMEKDYQKALIQELENKELKCESQKPFEMTYKGAFLNIKRIDILVENTIVVELKVGEFISKAYVNQVISYLKATNLQVGLLVCFSKDKVLIKRVVNT